jgi:hypothetical protein
MDVEEGCGADGDNVEIPAPHRLIRLNKPGKRTVSRGCNWLKGLQLNVHCKKRLAIFPSIAGMSLTKGGLLRLHKRGQVRQLLKGQPPGIIMDVKVG